MATQHHKINHITITLIFTMALMGLFIYIFYPGFLNSDSIYQLQEATKFQFSDWHLPMMSFVWSLLNRIHYGPAVMLVYHNLLFWSALLLFACYLFPKNLIPRLTFILAFGSFPTIELQLGAIVKDTALSTTLFLAAILLLYLNHITQKCVRIVVIALILLLLFYGLAVRLNALPAIVVLACWLAHIACKRRWLISLIIGGLITASLYGANLAVTNFGLKARHFYPFQQVELYDLATLSLANHTLLFPDSLIKENNLTLEGLQARYDPAFAGSLFFVVIPYARPHLILLADDPAKIATLHQTWQYNILRHPIEYLKGRLIIFIDLIAFSGIGMEGSVCGIAVAPKMNNWRSMSDWLPHNKEPALIFTPSPIYNYYCDLINSDAIRPLINNFPYFIICLIVILGVIYWRRSFPDSEAIVALALSGFLYLAGNFFYTPANEFRYGYWSIIAALAALSLALQNIWFYEKSSR